MWFDHHHVVSIPSSLSSLCWEKILLIDIAWLYARVIPVVLEMDINSNIIKMTGDVVHILFTFLPNVVVESLKGSIQTVNRIPQSLFQSHTILFLIYVRCPQNGIWDSAWCHNTEGLPLTQISSWTSRPHYQLGEVFTCQESSSSADGQWLLNSTILRTRQQKPLVYGIVSVSSFSSCVHRVLLTIFAIICLRGHGKWCLCPPLPFCIKLIFGTA